MGVFLVPVVSKRTLIVGIRMRNYLVPPGATRSSATKKSLASSPTSPTPNSSTQASTVPNHKTLARKQFVPSLNTIQDSSVLHIQVLSSIYWQHQRSVQVKAGRHRTRTGTSNPHQPVLVQAR